MQPRILKFVRILRIELEDLQHDLGVLAAHGETELERHLVPEHVCLQNLAVLRNECFGIRHFLEIIESAPLDDFANVDLLADHLGTAFKAEIERAGLSPAAHIIAARRIEKVRHYVTECLD